MWGSTWKDAECQETGWGLGTVHVDRAIAKEYLSHGGSHGNVACLHKKGPRKYFHIKILYGKTLEPRVCVVAGEGCLYLFDHLKFRRAISLFDGLCT